MRHAYFNAAMSQGNKALALEVKSLLEALGNRYVAYYPVLTELTGSPKASLMLGHAMYMTRVVMEKQTHRDGWFWKTSKEWKQVTGLSIREIETARKVLLKDGILQESRRGMPAKLWFRVDLNKLAEKLCQHTNMAYRPWDWQDRVLKSLLGKPVLFYAPFAWMANSALAGIYMSSLVNRLRISISQQNTNDGWFISPTRESLQQLQFGRRMMMNARAKLVEAGMIKEGRENRMKALMLSRLELTTLPAKIAVAVSEFHSLSDSDILDCRNPTIKSCSKRETTVADNVKQQLPITQNNSCSFSATSSAERATSLYVVNTTYHPLHTQPGEGVVSADNAQAHRLTPAVQFPSNAIDLIYPNTLLPDERQSALDILQFHDCQQPQLLLDELSGQMQDGHVKNAMKYLRTLCIKHQAGAFQPECAHKVANARRQRLEILEQRRNAPAPKRQTETDRASARRMLSDIKQSLWGKK